MASSLLGIFVCSCRQLQRGLGRLESQVERCCGDSEVCWVLVGECEGEVKRLGVERTHLLNRVKEIDMDIQRVGAPACATLIISVVAFTSHSSASTATLHFLTHTRTPVDRAVRGPTLGCASEASCFLCRTVYQNTQGSQWSEGDPWTAPTAGV